MKKPTDYEIDAAAALADNVRDTIRKAHRGRLHSCHLDELMERAQDDVYVIAMERENILRPGR